MDLTILAQTDARTVILQFRQAYLIVNAFLKIICVQCGYFEDFSFFFFYFEYLFQSLFSILEHNNVIFIADVK